MPLSMLRPGETYRIRKIRGEGPVKKHLSDLGFVEGEAVTLLSDLAGNLIVTIKDSRIALDKDLAKLISVA
ncbi:MAG: FeoA family protein [Peptococcaceae bacterium]|nr:FeoA family protein [Peptococcaceae bacterium]